MREQRRSRLSRAGHVDNHLAFYHCHSQYHPQGKVVLSSLSLLPLSLSLFSIINSIIIIMFDNDIIYRECWWSKADQPIRMDFLTLVHSFHTWRSGQRSKTFLISSSNNWLSLATLDCALLILKRELLIFSWLDLKSELTFLPGKGKGQCEEW